MSTYFNIKSIKNAHFTTHDFEHEVFEKSTALEVSKNSEDVYEKTTSIVKSIESNEYFHVVEPLLLRNSGNDCFINATVNILWMVTDIRSYFLSLPSEMPCKVSKELRSLFLRESDNVSILRKLLSPKLRKGQHDVKDAWSEILMKTPKTAKKSLNMLLSTRLVCEVCENVDETSNNISEVYTVLHNSTTHFSCIFEEKMSRHLCNICGNLNAKKIKSYQVSKSTTHFILQVFKSGKNQNILGLGGGNLEMMGKKWKINAFIEYIPDMKYEYGGEGHFVCWINQSENQWLRVSDNQTALYSEVNVSTFDLSMVLFDLIKTNE